jgi:uncharacterized BrkB/YihY/UPF0761 family membrane protein
MSRPDPDGPADEHGANALIAAARARLKTEQARLDALLEKHEDKPVIDVALRTYRRDREVAGTVVGSAIAFRLFLFFVPVLLFVVGLAGFLAVWVDPEDVNDNAGITGGLADQIRTAFQQPGSTRWLALLIGLFGIATTGRSLSKVMVASSSLAWRLPPTTKASVRVIGALVGLVAGIGMLAVLVNRVRAQFGVAVAGFSFLAVFVGYVLVWLAISMLLPRATKDPAVLLPGAVLVAGTLTGMQVVSQLYLPDRFGRASQLYGAVGTTIVTLGWFFIAGRAMVVAMCLNAIIHERFGTISRLVFSLPILRSLARRSAWVRRFFGLDDSPGGGPAVERARGEPGRGGGEDGGRHGVDAGESDEQGGEEQSGGEQPGLGGHAGGGAHHDGEGR